jgi:hypothetical protein
MVTFLQQPLISRFLHLVHKFEKDLFEPHPENHKIAPGYCGGTSQQLNSIEPFTKLKNNWIFRQCLSRPNLHEIRASVSSVKCPINVLALQNKVQKKIRIFFLIHQAGIKVNVGA